MPPEWTARSIPSQLGRCAIVTGANVGLGYQTARELARAGADVVLACRSEERGRAAADRIRAELPHATVDAWSLDLSRMDSVQRFAERVHASRSKVDILVNNAGIMALARREVSVDGWELQLATNYLGHFALTGLLLPVLLASGLPRVVSLSSNAHKRGHLYLDDLQLTQGYGDWKAYQQSKLAMLVYARALQHKADAHRARLLSVAAHPGLSSTSIGRYATGPAKYAIPVIFRLLGQDDAAGALPQLYAATAEEVTPGGYYGPVGFGEFKGAPGPAAVSAEGLDAAVAAKLWAESERITGVRYPWPAA